MATATPRFAPFHAPGKCDTPSHLPKTKPRSLCQEFARLRQLFSIFALSGLTRLRCLQGFTGFSALIHRDRLHPINLLTRPASIALQFNFNPPVLVKPHPPKTNVYYQFTTSTHRPPLYQPPARDAGDRTLFMHRYTSKAGKSPQRGDSGEVCTGLQAQKKVVTQALCMTTPKSLFTPIMHPQNHE